MHVAASELALCLGLDAEQALDYDVVDFGPHMSAVNSQFLEVRAECRQRPFVATITFLSVIILHKCLVLFVDRVVSQMGKFCLLTR